MLSSEGDTVGSKGSHFTQTGSYVEELLPQSLRACKERRKILLMTKKKGIHMCRFFFPLFSICLEISTKLQVEFQILKQDFVTRSERTLTSTVETEFQKIWPAIKTDKQMAQNLRQYLQLSPFQAQDHSDICDFYRTLSGVTVEGQGRVGWLSQFQKCVSNWIKPYLIQRCQYYKYINLAV